MKILIRLVSIVLLMCSFSYYANADDLTFESELLMLDDASYSEKAEIITRIGAMDDERVLPVMVALLNARLYLRTDLNKMIYTQDINGEFYATDVMSNEKYGVLDDIPNSKIRINNRLRRVLTPLIAVLQLNSTDKAIRFGAAKDLLKTPKVELRNVIVDALSIEKTKKVKIVLQQAIAMIDVHSDDQSLRLASLDILGRSVEPEAVAVLRQLVMKDESGTYIEKNMAVVESAEKSLGMIESRLNVFKFAENLIFGVSLGSILLLAAIGLAITFGVMGVINMAHGEMIMLGAYTTFAIQQLFPQMIGMSLFIAIPAAFLVSGCVGVLIERIVIRHLYGRPLDTLLATFGISLILQQAVRMYSSNNVAVITPEWMSGFWAINGAMSITYNRVYIIIFSIIVLVILALLLKKTMMGLQMRAVTQNRAMANSMGIRSGWVDALTFGLGSGIAGIAGVALSQITNVGPNLGQGYIIDSFMVVVFGGVGNLLGTFVGAMSLGIANKLLEPYAGAVIGKIIVLIFIILFIQWRPRGIFALKGRFVED